MRETPLAKKIAQALRSRGAWVVKTHGDPRQRSGLPDLVCCYRGRFIGLEVKVPGREGTLTKLQERTLDEIDQAGGLVAVVTTVEQALLVLKRVDRRLRN